jgi:hypothetical protein
MSNIVSVPPAQACIHVEISDDIEAERTSIDALDFVGIDPARFISTRHGVSLSFAEVIADAAGLHGGRA